LGFALQSEQITADAVRRAAGDLSLEQHAATDAVLHQQGAPKATRRVRQLWETCYSWFGGNVVRQRRFQASVAALVFGSLAIYLTLHGRSGTAQPTPETSSITASEGKAPELEPPPTWAVANKSDAMHGQEILKVGRSQDLPASFTYVIQPNDTLRDLCMSTVGRYDNAVIAQIRKLNPDLRDPNHLLVGQEIRFPLYPPK
jgi:LysM domain